DERRVDEDVVVATGLPARRHAIRNSHDTSLIRAPESRQHGLACIREDHESIDALRDHSLDVRDGLLRIALAICVVDRRDARTLLGLVARRSGRHQAPTVADKTVREAELDLLRTTPR